MNAGDPYKVALVDYDIELLDKLPQIVWRADLTGLLRYVNRFGLTTLGVDLDTALGAWFDLVHAEDRAFALDAWHRAVSSGEDYRVQARLRYADGGYRETLLTARRFLRQDAVGYWAGLCVDIDQQAADSFAPRYSGEDFRRIIEQAADGVLISDAGFRYLQVNAQACLLTGYSREALLDKTVCDLLNLEPHEVADIYGRVSRGDLRVTEWTLTRRDGSAFPAEVSLQVLADGRLVAFMRDVTERRRTRQRLEAEIKARTDVIRGLATELTLAEQRERKNLAVTLHDGLQQELYAVQFALAGLKAHPDESVQKVKRTVDELLLQAIKMARQATTDLRPAVLDSPDICSALGWLARSMQERYGLSVTLEGVQAYEIPNNALRTIVFNLTREFLFNTIKHAGVSEAKVSVAISESSLSLTVEDAGRGFDPALMTYAGSTGLGLSGAHNRLRLFGGELDIKSTPGEGTRVTMKLPVTVLSDTLP